MPVMLPVICELAALMIAEPAPEAAAPFAERAVTAPVTFVLLTEAVTADFVAMLEIATPAVVCPLIELSPM